MNRATAFFIGSGFWFAIFIVKSEGNPITFSGKPKPPNCPYGQCFIDSCIRICSCESPEGSIYCNNNLYGKSSMECTPPSEVTDNCPHGKTYKSPLWSDNFICYCNNDTSQTYECIDLSTEKSADVRELLTITRNKNNSENTQIIANGGKRNTESSIQQQLKIF